MVKALLLGVVMMLLVPTVSHAYPWRGHYYYRPYVYAPYVYSPFPYYASYPYHYGYRPYYYGYYRPYRYWWGW
ncbi:MAG TPA: hypothetical protein VGH16_03495 [Candidatus Binatia bacterium]